MPSSEPSTERYPVPSEQPTYVEPPEKVTGRRSIPLFELVATLFALVAIAVAIWLAAVLLSRGLDATPWWLLNLLFFWGVVAYLALPRLHQVVSAIYVPDYFIGRSRTADGMLGDPVNLAFDGREEDVHAALVAAGWTRADELTVGSALGMVRSAVLRRSYPAAPVSGLYVFGNLQDFAYQQEVDGNPSQRHHVRFWKVPEGWLLPGGQPVQWVAGATYDRAVGFSYWTGQVTHKIDANIDTERDYVVDTLRYADPASTVRVIDNFSTAYHARNGGGDAVTTDGDLPIVDLTGAARRHAAGSTRVGRRGVTDHHIPPLPLLLTGALLVLSLLVTLLDAFLSKGSDLPTLALSAVVTVMWWLVVARRRWAWVVLMSLLTFAAVDDLRRLEGVDSGGELTLILAGLSVLAVLAVSSESVRRWVRGTFPGGEPQVRV